MYEDKLCHELRNTLGYLEAGHRHFETFYEILYVEMQAENWP
jgi:hypothetical protein